ncbi:BRCA2-interacting transcriptional repressor EMSY [Holothuria leucospilota]|uniref:BRCA2-interacting transcriptional repressor EMSY n=1 Tax=Holothuria leucospilota TaxID=206669 RepID=A0A9Q1BQ63_HOLLE|nr:BRCA2-interacting transcriptional repressor EMSY [Holothuria leucospilota]
MGPPKSDMTPVQCQKLLRRLELEAYCGIVTALRAQGELTPEKKELLESVQDILSISTERHKAEVRRAVNDETLTCICEKLNDSNASLEWAMEGRRMVPLIPRLVPQTSYLQIANQAAMEALQQNRAMQLAEEAKSDGKVVKDEVPSSSKSSTSSDTGLPTKLSELIVLPRGTVLPQKSVLDNPNPEELFQKKKDQPSQKENFEGLPHVSKLLGKTGRQITPATDPSPGGTPTPQVSVGEPQTLVSSQSVTKPVHPSAVTTASSQMKGPVLPLHTTTPQAPIGYTHPQHPIPQSSKYGPVTTGMPVQSKPHFLHTALTGSSDYIVSRYSGYTGHPAGGVHPPSRGVGEKELHPITVPTQPKEVQKSSKSGHEKKSDSKSSKHRKHHSSKHVSVIQSTPSGTNQSPTVTKSSSRTPSTSDSSKHSSSKKDSHKEGTSGKVTSPTILGGSSKVSSRTPSVTSPASGSILKVTTVGSTPLPARITTVASGSSSTKYQIPTSYQVSSAHSAIISSPKMPPTSTPHSTPHSAPHIVKLNPKAVHRTAVVQKSAGSQYIPGKPNVIVVQKSQLASKMAQVPRPAGPGTMHPTSVSPIMNRPKIVMTTTASSLTTPHSGPGSVRFPSPKPSTKTQAQVIMSPGGRARQIIPSTVPTPVTTQSRNRMPVHQGVVPSTQRVPPTSPGMVIVRPKSPGIRLPASSGLTPGHVKGQERLLGQLEKMTTSSLPPGHGQYTKEPIRTVQSSQSPVLTEKKKQDSISQLSAATAARALLDIHSQPPLQSEPVKTSKPTELPKTSSVTMATSSSSTVLSSQSGSKKVKPDVPTNVSTKKDVPVKSSQSEKSVKGESPLVTIEDQGVVSARVNLTPTDVSEFVDQFEEFLEREGLMTSEQSSVTLGKTPQGSVSVVGKETKEGVKKSTQEVTLSSNVTKVSTSLVKIPTEVSRVPGVNQAQIIPTLEALATLGRKPVLQHSKFIKGNISIAQPIKSSPTLAKSAGQERQLVAAKSQDGSNQNQNLPSVEKKEKPKTSSDVKVVMAAVHTPKSGVPLASKSVSADSQSARSLTKDYISAIISDPGVSKSSKLFKAVTKQVMPTAGEAKPAQSSNDPYKWEDSPPVNSDPEPNMSELIRAISQPKISLTKLKQQEEPKKTEASEIAIPAKPIPDKPATQSLPKPASVVMETSSSFDVSHMNLEDFTSQRMEEDEARLLGQEEEARWKEKNKPKEKAGASVETQKGGEGEGEGDAETWSPSQESQQEGEGSEMRPGGEGSEVSGAQQISEKTNVPGGVGGGKKMPTSDKGDGGDYQAASGSEGSVSESSGSEMQQVRASKRKRKAPTPIDEETGPSSMPSWARAAWNLLQRVMRFRGANRAKGDINAASWFNRPVDPRESPEYFKIIKNPMDFSTIKRNLENGSYQGFTDFHQDMIMVRKNCLKFNPPGHKARRDCDEVYQFYQEEYNKTIDRWGKVQPNPKSPKRLRPDPSLK